MTPSQPTPLSLDCVTLILPRAQLESLFALSHDVQHTESAAQHQAITADQRQICLQIAVSQLVMLEGTSIDGILPGETDLIHISQLSDLRLSRKGGRRVKTACINCRDVGKRCDAGRPCSRCKKMGLHGCRDAPSKTKKATGKRVVSELAPDHLQSTAGPSTAMDEVGAVLPACHVVPGATDASIRFRDPASRYPTSDAHMSEAPTGPSTFGASDTRQMAYGYFNLAPDHLSHLVQNAGSSPVRPMTGFPRTHQPSIDMDAPQGYFQYDVASGSGHSLTGFDMYPSSQGPAADFQPPGWGHGW